MTRLSAADSSALAASCDELFGNRSIDVDTGSDPSRRTAPAAGAYATGMGTRRIPRDRNLSLERNRRLIFRHVAFGSLCSHEADIKSIDVLGSLNGFNTRDTKVSVSKDGDDDPVCTAFSETQP